MMRVRRTPADGTAARSVSVNVTVHGIGSPARPLDPGEDRTWITVEQFDRLLDAAVGQPHVTITFDDGNLSDLEIGLPRLLERGLTAEFFVCAGLLAEPGRLDASGVRELHGAGMLIGSHGWSHRDWRRLDWRRPESQEIQDEMERARQVLGKLTGTDVSRVAVPFGSYDRHVLAALRRTGVTRVYTSDGGWARRGSWLQARSSIHSGDGPDWARRVMHDRPSLRQRLRSRAVRTAKRLRA